MGNNETSPKTGMVLHVEDTDIFAFFCFAFGLESESLLVARGNTWYQKVCWVSHHGLKSTEEIPGDRLWESWTAVHVKGP